MGFLGNLKAHRYESMIDYLKENNCENILEIGTHKGHTGSELIKNSKNRDINYYGIDIFLDGWSEEIEKEEQSIKPNSRDDVYKFLNNYSKNITLFQGKSKDVHIEVEKLNIKFDLIWIDGGHSYDTVRDDFFMYLPLLKENGIIYFDDYTTEKSYPPDNKIPLGVKPFIDDLITMDEYDVEIINKYADNYRGHDYKIVSVKKKDDLTIITLVTPNNRKLLNDYFIPTLPSDIKNFIIYGVNGLELEKNNWTMSKSGINQNNKEILSRFIKLMNKKTKFQRDFVSNNIGKKIMFIDTDVVFFKPFKDDILQYLETHDMVLQDNNADYNGGIWAMNCNEKVLKLFNELYSEIFMNYKSWGLDGTHNDIYGEQAIINTMINKHVKENGLIVNKLPVNYYGNHISSNPFPSKIPKDCKLFHATNMSNLQQKEELLNNAVKLIK